jgi:tryptophan synthase alpha chain
MSRIEQLFKHKKGKILNVYCTAGFPELDSTLRVMKALQENGADLIELGIPYSDPLADGPIIQSSGSQALRNGMSIKKLFEQLKEFRSAVDLPLVLMGYMNPVLQFGFERFCETAAGLGVDGLILPDLPVFEFETEYGRPIRNHGLDFIFLVTPETSADRIRKVDSLSSGFLYAVSSSSTTGKEKDLKAQESYFVRLENMQLKNPVLVGFGIKDRSSYLDACRHARGVIIGSAYIQALENNPQIERTTKEFLESILK